MKKILRWNIFSGEEYNSLEKWKKRKSLRFFGRIFTPEQPFNLLPCGSHSMQFSTVGLLKSINHCICVGCSILLASNLVDKATKCKLCICWWFLVGLLTRQLLSQDGNWSLKAAHILAMENPQRSGSKLLTLWRKALSLVKKLPSQMSKKSRVWKYKEETLLLYLEHYQHQNHLINYFTCKILLWITSVLKLKYIYVLVSV